MKKCLMSVQLGLFLSLGLLPSVLMAEEMSQPAVISMQEITDPYHPNSNQNLILPEVEKSSEETSHQVVAHEGFVLQDRRLGIWVMAPNHQWTMTAGELATTLSHTVYYDATVKVQRSLVDAKTLDEMKQHYLESVKSALPGAVWIQEAQEDHLASLDAISMIYQDPAQKKIHRDFLIRHHQNFLLVTFVVKEENFSKVKADFSKILAGLIFE